MMTEVAGAPDAHAAAGATAPADLPVAHDLAEVAIEPSVVTIGNFDSVHRGHRVLLRRTVTAAADSGTRSVAITFDPHPAAVLRPGAQPPRLQTLEDRVAALVAADIDLVLVLAFTPELATWTPGEFVARVLVERLRAQRVVVGTNFRFGAQAAGDVVTLVEEGERHGFSTEAVTLLDLEGTAISSSEIRARLDAGDVGWVARAIGTPFSLAGAVVTGDGRGRTIGFPTANLAVPAGLVVPADGVYAGYATAAGHRWPAVANVGTRPTFAGTDRRVEVHLLDADEDLYGRELRFAFVARIRPEQRFDGPEALVARIEQDVTEARELLARVEGRP